MCNSCNFWGRSFAHVLRFFHANNFLFTKNWFDYCTFQEASSLVPLINSIYNILCLFVHNIDKKNILYKFLDSEFLF